MSEKDPKPPGPDHTSNGQPTPNTAMIWRRYVAGEPLTSTQQEQLQAALHEDTDFRQLVMDEQRVDRLLRLAAEDEASNNAFVARVMKKCAEHDQTAAATNQGTNSLSEFQVAVLSSATVRARVPSSRKSLAWVGWFSAAALLLTALGLLATYRSEIIQLAWPNRGTHPDVPNPSGGKGNGAESNQLPDLDATIVSQLNQPANQENAADRNLPHEELEPETPVTIEPQRLYASISGVKDMGDDARWQVGETLGSETLQLDSGELQLTMSSGTKIEVFAPSRLELTSENSLSLMHGEISANVPAGAHGFQVLTPGLAITDLGTVFDVAVGADGTTEVEVRQGRVAVVSRALPTQQQWNMNADETYQLTFYSPSWSEPLRTNEVERTKPRPVLANYPIASLARQQSGPATGVVSLDGRSMKFDDEQVFAAVRDRVFRGVQESPEEFVSIWGQFVEATTEQPQPVGQITVNGVDFAFGNFNEAVKTQQRVLAQVQPEPGMEQGDPQPPKNNLPVRGNFRGSLIINGQIREFESIEEYQAALSELIGPAARLGLFPLGNE
ncbi:MAG: FecR domain-containing protein [Planctomycetaceae bacterium]|nr:FecR domain-containing protein [Planctomycetaceae bacterium]